jgi:hypothetical protein
LNKIIALPTIVKKTAMKKKLTIPIILFIYIQNSFGQIVVPCDIKIAGNTFSGYENIVAFKEQIIFSVKKNISNNTILPNLDIFSVQGKKEVTIKDGKVISGDGTLYTITSSEKEYILTENATKKIICSIKDLSEGKSNNCQLDVSFCIFMPNGVILQISSETTSITFKNQSVGSTAGGIPVIYGLE